MDAHSTRLTGPVRSRSSQSPSPSHSASASATSSVHHNRTKLPPTATASDAPLPFPSPFSDTTTTRDGALTSNDDLDSISARRGGSDSDEESEEEEEYDDSSMRTFTASRLGNNAERSNAKIKSEGLVKVEPSEGGKDGGSGSGGGGGVGGGVSQVPGIVVKEDTGKNIFTENMQTSGAYSAREESLKREEEAGRLKFVCVSNDGIDEHMVWLIGLKNIFGRQLPNMPKEYIVRLIMDRNHKSVMVIRRNLVVGGITYRPYVSQKFGEIAFCAITADEQVKGYGTRLMNHLKQHARDVDGLTHFLTYADNNAVGYFIKQAQSNALPAIPRAELNRATSPSRPPHLGSRALLCWGQLDIVPHAVRYSALGIEIALGHKISRLIVLLNSCFGLYKRDSLREKTMARLEATLVTLFYAYVWNFSGKNVILCSTWNHPTFFGWSEIEEGDNNYIKDYDGGILMECKMDPKLPYTDISTMIRRQRQAIDEKIRELSNCHIVYAGIDFQKKEAGIPKKIVKVEDISGLREAGWTPDQWGHSRFKTVNASGDNASNQKSLTMSMRALLKASLRFFQSSSYLGFILIEVAMHDHPDAWPFKEPVDARDAPDYYDIIKDPMAIAGGMLFTYKDVYLVNIKWIHVLEGDLKTMSKRVESEQYYVTFEMFLADVRRMFANARTYNSPETIYYKCATRHGYTRWKPISRAKFNLVSNLVPKSSIDKLQSGRVYILLKL
ncbi:hypothetical protein RHSIM_Rhsim01G0270400 [Rhododendron simsii]|uniref:Histone acetyltransferase n=1 Tax=Rhododendron simsii TaxID=118357 RepID=A0A834LZ68_RHOSS|nr:hypothetical protein RHSIM_Rhsim01G0270400 [Rhododendron simsii]